MNRDSEARARRYIRNMAAAALLVLAAVAIFNAVVDPFRMYGLVTIRGFNAYKPEIYQRVRLLKAFDVRRIEPRAIALGTSRTHILIDPDHSGSDPRAKPRYNLAFDAATTREMYSYLLHAHATQPLLEVLLGLEYYHLNDGPSGTNPGFDPSLLRDPRPAFSLPLFLRADLKILTSMDTLEASIETIRLQSHAVPDWLAPDGQRLGEVFFHRPGADFTQEGPRVFFDKFMEMEAANKLDAIERAQAASGQAAGEGKNQEQESSLGYVMRIVEFCQQEGIDLRIFISPVHADELELAAAVGEYRSIEDGKRLLVRKVEAQVSRHPGTSPVPIYDFSGYSTITTEPLPPRGSGEEMAHYWDPSHAKAQVGDLIQDRVFGRAEPGRSLPPDFGVRIDSRNIDAVLARIRADQRRYRKEHPSRIADIHRLVERVRRERMAGGNQERAARR